MPLLPEHMALVTVQEAAERIHKPESTIRRWVADGLIPRRGWRGREMIMAYKDVLDAEHRMRSARTPGGKVGEGATP